MDKKSKENIIGTLNGQNFNVEIKYKDHLNFDNYFFKGKEYNCYNLRKISLNRLLNTNNKYKKNLDILRDNLIKIENNEVASQEDFAIIAKQSKDLKDLLLHIKVYYEEISDDLFSLSERSNEFFKLKLKDENFNPNEIKTIISNVSFEKELENVEKIFKTLDKMIIAIQGGYEENIKKFSKELASFELPYEIYEDKFDKEIISITNIYSNNYEKIRSKQIEANEESTDAEMYVSMVTSNIERNRELSAYLVKYNNKAHIKNEDLKYKEIMLFADGSLAAKNEIGQYELPYCHYDMNKILKEPLIHEINKKIMKYSTIRRAIIDKLEKGSYSEFDSAMSVIDNLINNIAILKNSGYDIIGNIRNKSFENVDDEINATIRDIKVKQYAHSISSNKHKHLYNDLSYSIFKELYDMRISESQLQNDIGTKLAAFNTPDEFNEILQLYMNNLNGFDLESIKNKITNVGLTPLIAHPHMIVTKIDNFEQSKILGSASWCIARESHYFKSYTSEGNSQYFIYDLTKSSENNLSMIGITIDSNGKYSTAHLKDDSKIEETPEILDIIKQINTAEALIRKEKKLSKNKKSSIE